jgi:sorbitol-specific phosphotransferase system component IIC
MMTRLLPLLLMLLLVSNALSNLTQQAHSVQLLAASAITAALTAAATSTVLPAAAKL